MPVLESNGNEVIYGVIKGDTLSEIAEEYNTTVPVLVKLNNIKDPNLIVVGQEIVIIKGAKDVNSINAKTEPKNTTYSPIVDVFGLQASTDRTMYATWSWDKDNTDGYQVIWQYDTGNDVWFNGSDTTVKDKQSIWTAPTNAIGVRFKVKAVPKTNNANTISWTPGWSTYKTYSFSDNPPTTPPTPTVTIDRYKLTAELTNLPAGNGPEIEIQVCKNDDDKQVLKYTRTIQTGRVSLSITMQAGSRYKVRCRAKKNGAFSEWSAYSQNFYAPPVAPEKIPKCEANSKNTVYIEWTPVDSAKYDIEYTTDREYFNGSNATTTISNIEQPHYIITGLEIGVEYYFRVRAVIGDQYSEWRNHIGGVVLGTKPAPPTTWSSTTTAIVGDPIKLYWMHNTQDGSSEEYADLEIYVDGVKQTIEYIQKSTDEDEKDKTSFHEIDTTSILYKEGTIIQWRVRTCGITHEFSDWSTQRTINIYAPPTVSVGIIDGNDNPYSGTIAAFPFYVSALAGPATQTPISYHVSVTSTELYETSDYKGNTKIVCVGDAVYSKNFDVSDDLMVELSPENIDLENNILYDVTVTVTMNSGLTATATRDFRVAWTEQRYEPNAEIGIDRERIITYVRPYCEDENGDLIDGVSLSLYRREFDGGFTELATGLNNTSKTFVVDPHPALDYARYRVVATQNSTGAISYYDLPGQYIGETAIVIQWNENWTSLEMLNEDPTQSPAYSGSVLKLPYNVDISDKQQPDVSFVQYIGRSHPVTYYGTQVGTSSTWKATIDKNDTDTLFALRRLAVWMGNVYAREPSGSGYWANVRVSIGKTHRDMTIPVTLEVTRVDGGA